MDKRISNSAKEINIKNCQKYYIGIILIILIFFKKKEYYCSASFPKCTLNDILPVCKKTCLNFLNNCPDYFWGGLKNYSCNYLPDINCTSFSQKLTLKFFFIIFLLLISTFK